MQYIKGKKGRFTAGAPQPVAVDQSEPTSGRGTIGCGTIGRGTSGRGTIGCGTTGCGHKWARHNSVRLQEGCFYNCVRLENAPVIGICTTERDTSYY
jgi:hypothetical protein